MKWMHLSDLHFNPGEDGRSTKQLRAKLPLFLKEQGIIVDEVFVTGDYRHAGKQPDTIEVAQSAVDYLKLVAESVGVNDPVHIHLVPGNHDLNRQLSSEEITRIRDSYAVDAGRFADSDLTQLIECFDFFRKVEECLHADQSIWMGEPFSLHKFQCFDEYSLLYLNTAITCGDDSERGSLVIGNDDLYTSLEQIKQRNSDVPIIVLAHHAVEYFSKNERETVERLFADYPVKIYLCGDSHEIWFRKINSVLEITMGCILQADGVQAVFSVGEIANDSVSISAYNWDRKMQSWGRYEHFNQQVVDLLISTIYSSQRLSISDEWFTQHNTVQIKNLGNRYMPELHIPLEIHGVTSGVARDEVFKQKFLNLADQCLIALKKIRTKEIDEAIVHLKSLINDTPFNDCSIPIDIQGIDDAINTIIDVLWSGKFESNESEDTDNYYTRSALNKLYAFEEYIQSEEVRSSNSPYILIHGDGGIGKSHMVADMIMERDKNKKKSILLLGQHFQNDIDPIAFIALQLHTGYSIDEIFQYLNQKAEAEGARILIVLDALNEGAGKSVWPHHLAGLIQRLYLYPWIGLVATIRSQYLDDLLYDNDYLSQKLILIEHHGLANAEHSAISKYFEHYNVPMSLIPPLNPEFENPLFLRLFCENFSTMDQGDISLGTVYSNYMRNVNKRVAEKLGYSSAVNVVQKSIECIAELTYSQGDLSSVDLEAGATALAEIAQRYNIHADLLGALLSEGILTQSILYGGSEFLYITYEKMENYVYALKLANEVKEIGIAAFSEKYSEIQRFRDTLQMLAITLAEKCGLEIFELFPEEKEQFSIIEAFIYSLQWRSASSISAKSEEYINEYVCKYEKTYEMLVETLVMLSTKPKHPYSINRFDSHLRSLKLPIRDALFVPSFDALYSNGYSAINKLIDWGLFEYEEMSEDFQMVLSASIMLSWFLLSPTNSLRDRATKALINLGTYYPDIVPQLLDRFSGVDDPYILERLYAVAFGCAVVINKEDLRHLAESVYKHFFSTESIYPNVLLRDYAKNVIDYAFHVLSDLQIDYSKVKSPYSSQFPSIPSDEEVKKYNSDKLGERDIWRSMKVEYSREGEPGGYGDFGRYTFQRYFSAWDNLHPMDLKNIAIKRIYDLGYSTKLHGEYDDGAQRDRYGRSGHERIGKKYQWIAMYELAAQVSDNYTMRAPYSWKDDTDRIHSCGSFEPSIRNIDPTIKLIKIEGEDIKPLHQTVYCVPDIEHSEWVSSYEDFPEASTFLQLVFQEKQYILLEGNYVWVSRKELGHERYQHPTKRMWIQVKSCICHVEDWDSIYKATKDIDTLNSLLLHSQSSYGLFNKEYYWSEAYKFSQNPYYGDSGWIELLHDHNIGKVMLTSSEYATERSGDLVDSSRADWHKPCEELFCGLKMRYGKGNSILYNDYGEVVCFDSKEAMNEKVGLFVSKESLLSFLDSKSYKIFWIVESEKMIIGNESLRHSSRIRYKIPRASGVYYLDLNKDFSGYISVFED